MKINAIIFFKILLLILISPSIYAINSPQYRSGFQTLTISDSIRPLEIAVWYPTAEQKPISKIGEDDIFEGVSAISNAKIENKRFPLVVISHGLGGSWVNQAWLASALSQHGYIVASPNHPGTTIKNMNRLIAQDMLQRPKDISRTITYLLSDKFFSHSIDFDKISVIGHSYGGWAAIETIGGEFSASQFKNECLLYPSSISCKIFNKQMKGLNPNSSYFKLDQNMRDARIKSAITLDLSFARGFTAASLSTINIPVLLLSADFSQEDDPAEFESQYIICKN